MVKNGINTAALKKYLPHGAIKEIAKRSDMSIYTVSRVLKGGSTNAIILKNIKDYIEEMQQTNNEINALVS